MTPFILEPTEESPGVVLDAQAGRFEISGKSYPEDAVAFYQPIFRWLKKYSENPNPQTEVSFKLLYFNTASQKLFLDLLLILDRMVEAGKEVSIDWYYDEEDESMRDAGDEFANLLDVPIRLHETVLD